MSRNKIGIFALVLATSAAPALPASAQVAGRLEVGLAGMLGVGHEGEVDSDRLGATDDDLDPSGGFALHALYTVLTFLDGGGLDVGGRFATLWWQAEDDIPAGVPVADHGTLIDLSVMAKPRLRFLDERLEVFLKVPFGLTISVLEDLPGVTKGRTGAGVNFGLLPGVSWTFDGHWGLFLDLGYALHWVRHEGRFKAGLLGTISDTQEYTAHEFALNLGLAYRF
jgi:hypothetical protein